MNYVLSELLKGERVVGCYYKNQGIYVHLDVWAETVAKRMSKDLTDAELIAQTDRLHDDIAAAGSETQETLQVERREMVKSIVYVANIHELLIRKLIQNDDDNGFLNVSLTT
jgi:hypothetical protein